MSSIRKDDIAATLERLRDSPVAQASNNDLVSVFKFLITDSSGSPDAVHWFCSQASPLVVEAATFMLRLHAYNSSNVIQWRKRLQACLGTCSQCVKRLQEVKETSRQTYFGAYGDPMLKEFYKSFSTWELEIILGHCSRAQIFPDKSPEHDSTTLADVPPSIFLLMLSNLSHLRDPGAMNAIRSYIPDKPITSWPLSSPPVGIFLLLMDEKLEVRTWAYQQIALYKTTPMPAEQFLSVCSEVLEAATNAITSLSPNQTMEPWSPGFAFPSDPAVLWPGYCTMLRFVPVGRLQPSSSFKLDLRNVIIAHLSDTGSHFPEVLKAFLLLLSRLGPKLWEGEGEEYPQVLFNTIKNNSAYAEGLQIDQPNHSHWTIQWMESYVKSLADMPGLQGLFPLMIQYLCEELQHERFKNVRASAICIAAKLLDTVLAECSRNLKESPPILSVALESLDIHANIFTSVAFGKAYMSDAWTDARTCSRGLVKTALRMDAKLILTTLIKLATLSSKSGPVANPKVREQLWKKTYESVLPNDSDGVAAIVHVLSYVAHVDDLNETAFSPLFKNHPSKEELSKVLRGVNRALKVFRTGFAEAISRFLDFTEPSSALALLRQKGMTENVMTMMFSPLEALRSPVQSLVGLALDVESRADCFRAMLQTNPDGAFTGIFSVLESFVKITGTLPEACGLSKSLALCLTDIIDVLCATPDGLLHKTQFLQSFHAAGPELQLPKLWNLMTKAITQIFQRTPRWAEYFENDMMITWMRDALIFGRDMLAQRKVIESGALALSPQSSTSRGKSHTGTKMVDDLQPVLLELTRWLRLTDEELLFQAFALLQSLLGCFQEAGVKPSEPALQKLQKHVKDAKTPDPKRPQTKLDSTRLDRLQDAISAFEAKEEESDEEIQIISHIIKAPPERKQKTKAKADVKEPASAKFKPTTVTKSAKSIRPEPARRASAKSSINNYFTSEDRRKLDAASNMPKFKASSSSTSVPKASAKPATSSVGLPSTKDGSKSGASSSAPSVAALSSDDSSSDDDGESGLAALAKLQRTPTIRKPPERRQVMMLDIPGQAKNPVLERLANRNARDEARRTTLRLKPDITPLHRVILSWDYDADGPQPPGENLRLNHVPDRFDNEQHYRRTFEPLLLLECWAQMQQSKEVNGERYSCQVMTRQYSDDWIDLDIQITDSVGKDWSLSDTEIVLLRQPDGKQGFLCKVQNYRTTMASINVTLRMASSMGNGPQITSTWMLKKVLSLTTVHREYSALMGLPFYDLCPVILRPRLPEPARTNPQEVSETMKAYNLNEPQAKAILSALRTDGFSLIQGPPGTGKTSTICGLVQAFLAKRPKPATAIYAGRSSGPMDRVEPKKKILLCAPSNAAIDEITYRLKEGVSGPGRTLITPKVVRVGGNKMSLAVKDVSLDFLVEQKMNTDAQARANAKDVGSDIAVLRSKLDAVKRQREQKLAEMMTVHDNTTRTFALEEDVRALNKERIALTSQLDKLRDQQKSSYRALDALGRKVRAEILQDADVICTTLAGAGHDLLEPFDFEMVVIDEAAQAIELSSLIPLKYRCSRCVMVGDPQQLPPTVISTEASKYSYNQSLFVRLQKDRPDAVHLLSIQYRMHPDISILPSRLFYRGRLLDGPGMQLKTQKPWHNHPKFGPYRFYNVLRGIEETGSGHSFLNRAEAEIAVALYNRMHQEFASKGVDFTVGVVTMYKAQMFELRRAFERRFGSIIAGSVDFNTVDGFQGQEKDVIILSCVRAGPGVERVGFLADVRRMNVALTRAKSSVFILGNAATLERSNNDWKTIVTDARSRSCLIDVDVPYFTSPVQASDRASAPKARVPSKTKTKPPTPLPELSTPRQLATASQRPSSSSSSQPMTGIELTSTPATSVQAALAHTQPPGTPQSLAAPAPPVGHTPPGLGQKRPAEEDSAAAPDAKRRPPPGAERPAQKPKPPPIRKKEKPSIFLPSKRPGARR